MVVSQCAALARTQWRTVTLPVLLPFAIGLGSLAAAFQYWYGTFDPQSGYRGFDPNASTFGSGGWDFWYEFLLRDIFDSTQGWIPFAPVHWLGLAALGCLVLWFRWSAVVCLAGVVSYVLFVTSFGASVGSGLPARYELVVIPLIAIPIAVAIQGVRVARVIFVPLLAVSLVFAVAAVRDYDGSIRSTGRNTSSDSAAPRPHTRSFPSLSPQGRSHSLQTERSHLERGSWKRARWSPGPAETSGGSSCTAHTPR